MMKKSKVLLVIFFIFLLLFITFIFSILYVQPSLFFYPWHDKESYDMLLSEEDFEEIRIDNNGKLLDGWLKYNTKNPQAPLLIFFGGNMQNSSNTCINFLNSNTYQYFENYNVLMVDYPGYGLSDGKPSDKTMFSSALKVYDYACNLDCVDKDNIVVLGYSIGTGVATYVASQRNVNGLILIAPYDRALSLYNDTFNIFYGPLKLLARYKFDSISYAQNVSVSPLIITSYDDEVIDYKLSLNLAKYFNDVDETLVLNSNVKHNDYFLQEDVLRRVYEYLQKNYHSV